MTARDERLKYLKENCPDVKWEVVAKNDPNDIGLFYNSLSTAQAFRDEIEKYLEETWDVEGKWNKTFWKEKPTGWTVRHIYDMSVSIST